MNPPYPDRNDWKRRWWLRSPRPGRIRKLIIWFTVGGLIALVGSHTSGESDANLANGNLRFKEYRAFFLIRSDERVTELSRLARAAGYVPPPDVWVNCKSYFAFGPIKVLGNGWDMEAHSLIRHAG